MVDYCHICRNVNISTTTVPMTTKLGRLVIYYEELLLIKPHDSLIMWSSKITWQTKTVISPLSPCLATNLDWMVTYCFDINGRLLAIKSYEPLIAWSCKISTTTVDMAIKLGTMVIYLEGLLSMLLYLALLSTGLVRSHDKLKPSYLH